MNNAYCYETKIGKIVIVENGIGITQLYFGEDIPKNASILQTDLLKKANEELKEYFRGKREEFDLPLAPQGTEFQKKVWRALQEIPYGKTYSYKHVAVNIGKALELPKKNKEESKHEYEDRLMDYFMGEIAKLIPKKYRGIYDN